MPEQASLQDLILHRIHQAPNQRISFADFMEMALYHPQQGYYASQDAVIGPQGDFITSPHMGHDFGELLAVQFAEMWRILGRPSPFTLVEMGAGQGLVAQDVLSYLQQHAPDCFAALDYRIVEKSAALQAVQRKRLAPWQAQIQWTTLEAIPANTVTGCLFSNELVDALPVHLVIRTEAGLQEIYVSASPEEGTVPPSQSFEPTALTLSTSENFVETVGDLSTPALATYFEAVGMDLTDPTYEVGYRTEVNLAALDWMTQVAERLHRGYVLTIDYGYPANRYYNRVRSQGTLQCYYQHTHHNDPYCHIGQQDITAHVDFTALERQGAQCGLTTLGLTQQAMFLMALGLGDRLNELAQTQGIDGPTIQQALRRRDTLHRLIDPMGLGNFGVLIQGKGLTTPEEKIPLKGLTIPPLA